MPIIGALSGVSVEEERRILDDIEHQFHLDEDALIRITQQFLEDMHLGLGEYSHPLAMMYVFSTYSRVCDRAYAVWAALRS